jgi:hypothetical protein
MPGVTTFLPYIDEPEDLRLDLNTPGALVRYPNIGASPREATIRQGGAFLKRVWPAWKEILMPAGVRYQDLISASAANDSGWRDWADTKPAQMT